MNQPSPHLVIGVGSSRGNDAIGFRVAERIQAAGNTAVRCLQAKQPIQIVTALDGCRHLWVIDACCSGQPLGAVMRLEWPIESSDWPWRTSTHAIGLVDALQLAAGARLCIKRARLMGVCGQCSSEFRIEQFRFQCHRCGSTDVNVSGGEELMLESVTMEAVR